MTDTIPPVMEVALEAPREKPAEHVMYFPNLVGFSNDPTAKYHIGEMLSRGNFGEAWTLVRASDRTVLAGKVMLLGSMSDRQRLRAKSEVSCICAVSDHFGCVNFVEDCEYNDKLLIIMEYCDAGDLGYQLQYRHRNNQRFDEPEIKKILLQLVLSLNVMHRHRILHRDLKAKNILISTSGIVKIGDFGLSRAYDQSVTEGVAQTFCGTPLYIAPELWRSERYGKRADVWSLGCILYEMMALRPPFRSENWNELREEVLRGLYAPLDTTRYSQDLINIVHMCLRLDASTRIDTDGLLMLPYLREALMEFPSAVELSRSRMTPELYTKVMDGLHRIIASIPTPGTAAPVAAPTYVAAPAAPQEGVLNSAQQVIMPGSTTPIIFEGPVKKFKSEIFTQRYMMMDSEFIHILRHKGAPPAANAKPLRLALIDNVTAMMASHSNSHENVFSIQEGTSAYWFQAPDADSMHEWVRVIRAHMAC